MRNLLILEPRSTSCRPTGISLEDGDQVYLAAGANTVITVTVTAEDGSTNTYTVTVYRERATPSSDATLSALRLSGAVLLPVFDPERTDYTATAAYDTDITTVTATANDIGAMVPVIMTDPARFSRRGGNPGDPFQQNRHRHHRHSDG